MQLSAKKFKNFRKNLEEELTKLEKKGKWPKVGWMTYAQKKKVVPALMGKQLITAFILSCGCDKRSTCPFPIPHPHRKGGGGGTSKS